MVFNRLPCLEELAQLHLKQLQPAAPLPLMCWVHAGISIDIPLLPRKSIGFVELLLLAPQLFD